MTRFLALFTFVLVSSFGMEALACRGKERAVGPVCVSTEVIKIGLRVDGVSKVWFDDDPKKTVVWQDLGYVNSATRTKLVVIERRLVDGKGMEDVEVVYVWNGTKFVER